MRSQGHRHCHHRYENVQVEEGSYLVPLLYPSAQKLAAAAQSTLADGYRIKIYDAYRPREASTEIYQITSQHLEDPIPDTTYTGQPVDDLPVGIPLLSQLEAQRAAQQAAQQNDAQTGTRRKKTAWPAPPPRQLRPQCRMQLLRLPRRTAPLKSLQPLRRGLHPPLTRQPVNRPRRPSPSLNGT